MDTLLRLLHLSRFVKWPQKPATPSRLESLPTELIELIIAWLPPSSAVSLSLCNHRLHVMFSERALHRLSHGHLCHIERGLLLEALDRDLSTTLYCFLCNKLHVLLRRHEHRLGSKQIHRRVSNGRCWRSEGTYNYGSTRTYHAGFKFEHVQMAMKLYRRGLLSEAKAYLTRLAIIQPARGQMSILPCNMGLYFFEPRFVRGQISVRAQSWVQISGALGFVVPREQLTTVCAHLSGDSPKENPYVSLLRCKMEHLVNKQDRCEKCSGLIRCRFCPTEVCVEAKRLDKDCRGGFLVITKWQMIGRGLSPFESHWRTHLEPRARIPWAYLPDCAPGSIQAGYEDQPGIRHDSLLTAAEAWKLLDENH